MNRDLLREIAYDFGFVPMQPTDEQLDIVYEHDLIELISDGGAWFCSENNPEFVAYVSAFEDIPQCRAVFKILEGELEEEPTLSALVTWEHSVGFRHYAK